jgi:hypothetical protein
MVTVGVLTSGCTTQKTVRSASEYQRSVDSTDAAVRREILARDQYEERHAAHPENTNGGKP